MFFEDDRSARLKAMAFLHKYSRCWCLSVGFMYRSVDILPSLVKKTLTSRKVMLVEECELVE